MTKTTTTIHGLEVQRTDSIITVFGPRGGVYGLSTHENWAGRPQAAFGLTTRGDLKVNGETVRFIVTPDSIAAA